MPDEIVDMQPLHDHDDGVLGLVVEARQGCGALVLPVLRSRRVLLARGGVAAALAAKVDLRG
jgi:hypothetical protein